MTALWPLGAYLAIKLAAYVGWCSVLVGWHAPAWWRGGPGLGAIRLGIGAIVGGSLTAAGIHLQWAHGAVLPFVALLIPVRWVEWSLAAHLGSGRMPTAATLLAGLDGRMRLWQAGGIVVSCATDAVLLLAGGLVRALVC